MPRSRNKIRESMITDWNDDRYDGTERFPKYLDANLLHKMEIKYESMPEEYYTTSGLPIVTPDNFDDSMLAHADVNIT